MKTVMCAGTFDILHQGHFYYLTEAKKHGTRLVVVVARDNTSTLIKGRKPLNEENKRLEAVKKMGIADRVVLGKEGNIFDIVREIKPDVICLGYDQNVEEKVLNEELKKRNVRAEIIRICPYMPEKYKSSKLRGK